MQFLFTRVLIRCHLTILLRSVWFLLTENEITSTNTTWSFNVKDPAC